MVSKNPTIGEFINKRIDIQTRDSYTPVSLSTVYLYDVLKYETPESVFKTPGDFEAFVKTGFKLYRKALGIINPRIDRHTRSELVTDASFGGILKTILKPININLIDAEMPLALSNTEILFIEEVNKIIYGDASRLSMGASVFLTARVLDPKITGKYIPTDNGRANYYDKSAIDEFMILISKLSHNEFMLFMRCLIGLCISVLFSSPMYKNDTISAFRKYVSLLNTEQ